MRNYSNETMTLMFADKEVMRFNFSTNLYTIINKSYIPYGLRGKLVEVDNTSIDVTNFNNIISIISNNRDYIRKWFAQRTLSLSRANAKKLFNLINFAQLEDVYTKYDMAITCRGVSVLDEYWVRFDDMDKDISWGDVDLRRNHLNQIVAQVALHGDSLSFQGSFTTPEFTTNGLYPKAWRRHSDGKLWLHKMSLNGNSSSEVEVSVSNILDKCNVDHVHYEAGEDEGKYVCMCPCIADDQHSIISANEYKHYCSENSIDFMEELLRIDHDGFYKMHIVDYLICNHDRHYHNWGFYMDNATMEIVSLHPLFDHNNSFDPKYIPNIRNKVDTAYINMRKKAKFAMGEVDFHFTSPIVESDFVCKEHFNAFMEHAGYLGVKTINAENPFASAASKMNRL